MRKTPVLLAAAVGLLFPFGVLAAHHNAPHRTAQPAVATSQVVWVNLTTGIYHLRGERWYGRTKHGIYMPEAEAKRRGYRETWNGQ